MCVIVSLHTPCAHAELRLSWRVKLGRFSAARSLPSQQAAAEKVGLGKTHIHKRSIGKTGHGWDGQAAAAQRRRCSLSVLYLDWIGLDAYTHRSTCRAGRSERWMPWLRRRGWVGAWTDAVVLPAGGQVHDTRQEEALSLSWCG